MNHRDDIGLACYSSPGRSRVSVEQNCCLVMVVLVSVNDVVWM